MESPFSPPDGDVLTEHPPVLASDTSAAPPLRHPDAIITGLSAVLAERLGLDPLWVRIGFVLLSLVGGIGLVVYLGLWLVFVFDADRSHGWARVAGGLIVLGGVPFLISETDLGFASGAFAVIALLGGLALALWRSAPDVGGRSVSVPDWRSPTTAVAAPAQPSPQRSPRVRPEPSILGQLTVGLAVIVAAGGALIDELNGGRLHPEQWLGAGAVVCGLGLLVGAVRGHARWLIVPAIVFAGIGYSGGLLARAGISVGDVAGERHLYVGADSANSLSTDVGFGRTVVSILETPREPTVVHVTMAMGELLIEASDHVAVEIRSTGDAMDVRLDGQTLRSDVITLGPDRAPDVVVNATLFVGTVEVRRVFSDAFLVGPDGSDVLVSDGPPAVDQVTYVADGVGVTPEGWLVLGNRDAIVTADLEMVFGQGEWSDGGEFVVETSFGPYRIVGDVLLTPELAVYRLGEIRAEATAVTTTTLATDSPDQSEPAIPQGDG